MFRVAEIKADLQPCQSSQYAFAEGTPPFSTSSPLTAEKQQRWGGGEKVNKFIKVTAPYCAS